MKKIVFFDIDRTLFDPELFLNNFYKKISEAFKLDNWAVQKLQKLYEESRGGNGYFMPDLFLDKITAAFPNIDKTKLNQIFWSLDLFQKSLYKDSLSIKNLSDLATLGIFSKGDNNFQLQKLDSLKDALIESNIYIFPNKIEKIAKVLGNYKGYKIYFVDNDIRVLLKVKEMDTGAVAILIDRLGDKEDNENIIRINNLNQVSNLI